MNAHDLWPVGSRFGLAGRVGAREFIITRVSENYVFFRGLFEPSDSRRLRRIEFLKQQHAHELVAMTGEP